MHMKTYTQQIVQEYQEMVGEKGPLKKKYNTGTKPQLSSLLEKSKLLDLPNYDPHRILARCLFLSRMTRPEISYAVGQLSRLVHRWSAYADQALRHLIEYLSTTLNRVLFFPEINFRVDRVFVETYSDSDLAGDIFTSKSTHGYASYILFQNSETGKEVRYLADSSSKLAPVVSASTADAELGSLNRATLKSSIPLQIFMESVFHSDFSLINHCDNTAAIAAVAAGESTALRYLAKTQRISIPLLHEIFAFSDNRLQYVNTAENVSDIGTKFLSPFQHEYLSQKLGLVDFQGHFDS